MTMRKMPMPNGREHGIAVTDEDRRLQQLVSINLIRIDLIRIAPYTAGLVEHRCMRADTQRVRVRVHAIADPCDAAAFVRRVGLSIGLSIGFPTRRSQQPPQQKDQTAVRHRLKRWERCVFKPALIAAFGRRLQIEHAQFMHAALLDALQRNLRKAP